MHGANELRVLLAACLVVALGGCTGSALDDGDSADVGLFVQTMTVPPVTTSPSPDCTTPVFTVPNATATLLNQPKNASATSPFQDVILQDVVISYQWDDEAAPGGITPTRVVAISGTVQVGKTGTVQFIPIFLGDLTPDREGHSANLTLTFRGRTFEGRPVASPPSDTAGTVLSVNACIGA